MIPPGPPAVSENSTKEYWDTCRTSSPATRPIDGRWILDDEVWNSLKPCLKRDVYLHPSKIRTGATMNSDSEGNVDVEALKALADERTCVFMLTLPSTLGLFEPNILEITNIIHEAGGLVYADGANLNALLGIVKLGDLGFDIAHSNLHKTFSTPHGCNHYKRRPEQNRTSSRRSRFDSMRNRLRRPARSTPPNGRSWRSEGAL